MDKELLSLEWTVADHVCRVEWAPNPVPIESESGWEETANATAFSVFLMCKERTVSFSCSTSADDSASPYRMEGVCMGADFGRWSKGPVFADLDELFQQSIENLLREV